MYIAAILLPHYMGKHMQCLRTMPALANGGHSHNAQSLLAWIHAMRG